MSFPGPFSLCRLINIAVVASDDANQVVHVAIFFPASSALSLNLLMLFFKTVQVELMLCITIWKSLPFE